MVEQLDPQAPPGEGMHWLTGDWPQLGAVAAKAALMYVAALLGLRVGQRRTLTQWTIIDVATAVALGAIIGRTAIAHNQSFITGAVALVTLLAVHRLASVLRFHRLMGRLSDHRIRVLVEHGQIRRDQMRICGLTDDDLYAELRRRGFFSLESVALVLYEAKGTITIVPEDDARSRDMDLVAAGLAESATPPR